MAAQNYGSLKSASITFPVANTDLGTNTSPYGNLFLSGNLNLGNTVASGNSLVVPKISSVTYPNSATAANPAGGETITINGSGFLNGANVYLANVTMPSASVVNINQITFTSPVKSAGSYTLAVINSDGGTATFLPGITFSNVPVFTTSAGTLGTVNEGVAVSNTIAATSDSTITYSITSGALPSGLSINTSNGAITGTLSNVSSNTTYNFTVGADDQENQLSTRNFSYTIIADTLTWNSPSNNTTYTSYSNSAISNVTLSATSAFGATITYTAKSLPTGLSLTGSNIAGTPTVVANSSTIISATTSTKQANIQLNWSIQTPPPVNAIYSWGYNNWGQLGLGDTTNRSSPTQVGSDTNWTTLAVGTSMVTAKKSDGTIWNWGTPQGGEDAGLGTHYTPSQIGVANDWKLLSGARYSFFATKTSNDTRYAWGYNRYSDLGNGNQTNVTSPTQVDSQAWAFFAGSGDAAAGIKTNGTLWTWGRNLFTGPSYGRSSPVQIGTNTSWTSVSVGSNFMLAIRSDGTLWAAGTNNVGQLGFGNTTTRDIGNSNGTIGSDLAQVGALTTWLQAMAGYQHSIAVRTDGTLWAWGNNAQGQLGLGNTTNRSSPVQVGALTTWSKVAIYNGSTGRHSAAIKSDGTLWLWGYNNYGQLGLGDTTNRSSPTQVGSNTNWGTVYVSFAKSVAVTS